MNAVQSQPISATDLARNTREVLDRVVSEGLAIGIARNQTLIAQIVPPVRTMTAAQALAGLSLPKLTAKQTDVWLADSKSEFDDSLRSPWK